MRNELTILNALKTVVQTQLNDYLDENLPNLGERNVAIDFPDTDQMPMKTMLYIQPNWANYEDLSTESDLSNFGITLFIVCKKDTQENLTRKIYGYFNALYSLIRANISLDGEVDFSSITDADFYPAVEGNRNIQAIEVSITVTYTKDF
ncbi:MAG: hypothetical protein J5800_03605 [Spirochaetales bacterium]|nr:hypothetical protein [Spirochaetales bacterium]